MKKLLFAIFLTFLYSVSAYGQVPTNIPNTVIQVFPGAPTGACLSVMVATRQDTGAFYDCFGGVWAPVGGAGAGANSSLSNLSNPTAVNQSLIPGTAGLTLGTQANPWANIFIQSLTFPGLEVGFFCFPGTLPTPPTGYGGLGCIDANGLLDEYNIGASAWQPLVSGGTTNQIDVSATTGNASLDPALIFPGTASGKIINGVSYSALYTGATLDVRVNAAMPDAHNQANGNTSGHVSSVGEPVGSSIAAPITVLTSTEWDLPVFCQWVVNMSGAGGVYTFNQQIQSTILGPGLGFDSCRIQSLTGGYEGMYTTVGTGRFRAEGFELDDGSHSMLGGTVMNVANAEDVSYFGHIMLETFSSANVGLTVTGATSCCTLTFENFESNSVYTGGIPVVVNSGSNVVFRSLSADHPSIAEPAFKCIGGTVTISGLYEETYNGASAGPINDITGCTRVTVSGEDTNPLGSTPGTATSNIWQIESGANVAFTLTGLQAPGYNSSALAVNNIPAGTAVPLDAHSNLTSYSNNTSYVDTLAALLGFIGPSYTANGSTAGFIDFGAGATSSGNPLCGGSNVICEQAPTAVTSYLVTKPGAAPTVANSYAATSTAGVQSWASANYQLCGTTTTCSATAEPNAKIVYGSAPLVSGTPSTAAVTGISPAFTSTSSYVCTIAGQSAATTGLYSVANVSSSAFTITGPATTTTVLNYVCVGI